MKTIIAQNNQTLFDIALQEMGDIGGVFDILDVNPYLRLDMSIPAGTKVLVPDTVINPQVTDYLSRNGVKPASGLGEEVILNLPDMTKIVQKLAYDLSGGNKAFEGIRLWNLKDKVTVQVNYTSVSNTLVNIILEESLDGINYSDIIGAFFTINQAAPSHTFNMLGIQTNYIRLRVSLGGATTGTIDEVIFKV